MEAEYSWSMGKIVATDRPKDMLSQVPLVAMMAPTIVWKESSLAVKVGHLQGMISRLYCIFKDSIAVLDTSQSLKL
jgi:hypothetical protein